MYEEVDWVTTRAQCSVPAMFARLLAGVKSDVAARNALRSSEDTATFEVVEAEREFTVVRNNGDTRRVRFEHDESAIPSSRRRSLQFLRNDQTSVSQAECVFLVKGEEIDLIGVCATPALTKLFFPA